MGYIISLDFFVGIVVEVFRLLVHLDYYLGGFWIFL